MKTLQFWRRISLGVIIMGWSPVFLYCASQTTLALSHDEPIDWRMAVSAVTAFATIAGAIIGHTTRTWLCWLWGFITVWAFFAATSDIGYETLLLMTGLVGALTTSTLLPIAIWEGEVGDV
jgi:hypothetical protein